MASFTKKIFGLAGVATVFAGMAFGQATCSTPASNANFVPVEATAAQVAQLTFTCTGATAGALINVQVFVSPALPITSKVTASSSSTTEAVATVKAVAGAPAAGDVGVQGILTGTSLTFNGITLLGGANVITISNVRVNPSSLSVGTGIPPAITETAFISGAGATPVALGSTTVAFAQSGINAKSYKGGGAISLTTGVLTSPTAGATAFVICNKYNPATSITGSMAQIIQINENFVSAFKAASEVSQVSAYTTAPATATAISNAVNTNDRLKISFSGVPAGVTLYVPTATIPSTAGAATIKATTSETGAFAAYSNVTSTSIVPSTTFVYGGGVAAVPVTSGAGSVVFDVTLEDVNNLDTFNIPVFIGTAANAVPGSSTPYTVAVSYAPVGSTQIPNFVVGASTTSIAGSVFNTCTTSLLFPFVTNQLGFDTGLAIANTSTDPFGSSNGATNQAGTCSLNFYGSGAPSPANVTTLNVPTGTVYTQVLSGVAAGFQGYLIAQCNFQFAHGFAFITNGVGVNGGLSQGYLAGVIPDVNQVGRGANGPGAPALVVNGLGEVLGN